MKRKARRARAAIASWISLVFVRGARGWLRNMLSTSPALGSMLILLLLAGASAVAGVAVASAAATQSRDAYQLRVYLADQATAEQVDSAKRSLEADPRVREVVLVSREEALRNELRRPGMAGLVDAGAGNPFPASLVVTLTSPAGLQPVAEAAGSTPGVDPVYPTSYDPDAYARLRRLELGVGAGAAGLIFGLGLVAVAVTANAIRAAVVARRDEIRVMRLVGAPWWALRLPFVVEGALTGGTAGSLAGAAVALACLGAERASAALFTEFLPGVTPVAVAAVAAAVVTAGLLLGGASSAVALRRLPA